MEVHLGETKVLEGFQPELEHGIVDREPSLGQILQDRPGPVPVHDVTTEGIDRTV